MSRYLVLLDAPLTEESLGELHRLNTDGSVFHVVVPATSLSEQERQYVRQEELPAEVGDSDEVVAARWRLRNTLELLTSAGFPVSGTVGVENPVDAVDQALEVDDHDSVVLVTSPAGIAGRVKLDLSSRVMRHVDEPVLVVESDTSVV